MNVKETLVGFLRDMARQIQSMDEADLFDVVSGKARLELAVRGSERRIRHKSRQRLSDEQLTQLGERLQATSSREEGERLIRDAVTSKDEMVRLARKLDLPVQKSNSVDQLRARLIESTIGFRLRSAAVQGIVNDPCDKHTEPTG